MGNACGPQLSDAERADAKKSREIDALLSKDGKAMEEEVKLLLLGPGESGKSTFFKQMKILQVSGGFSEEERKAYEYIVFGNCITQMKVIVAAAEKLGNEYSIAENKERAEKIAKLPAGGDSWSREIGEDIAALWADKAIKDTFQHRDKAFQLNDSAAYFFDNVDRFCEYPNYVPSQDDILRARVRSTGIEEAEFEFDDLSFRMFDVGGQRSERRKWIHCFDCVTAVLFVTSLSEYDQTLREDDSQNRMKESLLLFDEICNSPWFKETAFMLFLNKTDLFKEKIQRVDLNCCFPEYKGGCNEEPAKKFILEKFIEQNQNKSHTIYSHYTMAIDT